MAMVKAFQTLEIQPLSVAERFPLRKEGEKAGRWWTDRSLQIRRRLLVVIVILQVKQGRIDVLAIGRTITSSRARPTAAEVG
jgi:hypothetical protein